MGTFLEKGLSWEIDNFSERKDAISSDTFSSGGCEWYVRVHPERYLGFDHLSLFLCVGNPYALRLGWKRKAIYGVILSNQSGEKLYTSPAQRGMFCAEASGWGVRTTVALGKLQEKGFLEQNKLTVQVYIKVVDVVHRGKSTANDMLEIGRFQIIASQAYPLAEAIAQHPHFAVDVMQTNHELKIAQMDLLLGLIETLSKSPQSLSVTELNSAQSQLIELTEAGFKLDWLKSKLEEVSLERKKELPDGWVQQLEGWVKKAELTLCDLKVELDKEENIKSAAAVYSFDFVDFFIKRFFLSCFSISKH